MWGVWMRAVRLCSMVCTLPLALAKSDADGGNRSRIHEYEFKDGAC